MNCHIHPSAHLDPGAELGPGCHIGPGAVIEAGARLGAGCRVEAHAVVTRHARIGDRNVIGHGAVIGGDPQILGFDREVESIVDIGADNTLREYCTVHRGSKPGSATRVGDGNYLMAGVHLGHDVQLANHTILANNTLLGGHVEVQDRAVIGGGSVFHQFVRIGRLAMVQGISGAGKDIPPFCVACRVNRIAGLNVIGMRRAGFDATARADIKRAYHLLYLAGHNVSDALTAAQQEEWSPAAQEFFAFVAQARRRGICAPLHRGGGNADEAGGGETE
jgi:UDP-N-acetylglucosamine acyltransferase